VNEKREKEEKKRKGRKRRSAAPPSHSYHLLKERHRCCLRSLPLVKRGQEKRKKKKGGEEESDLTGAITGIGISARFCQEISQVVFASRQEKKMRQKKKGGKKKEGRDRHHRPFKSGLCREKLRTSIRPSSCHRPWRTGRRRGGKGGRSAFPDLRGRHRLVGAKATLPQLRRVRSSDRKLRGKRKGGGRKSKKARTSPTTLFNGSAS